MPLRGGDVLVLSNENIIYPVSPKINGGIHSKGKKDLNVNFDVMSISSIIDDN